MKFTVEKIASVVPSIRAEIARELVNSYNYSQQDVSILLGVSQPAISQYVRQLRGQRYFSNETVKKGIMDICEKLTKGKKDELEQDIYNLSKFIADTQARQ